MKKFAASHRMLFTLAIAMLFVQCKSQQPSMAGTQIEEVLQNKLGAHSDPNYNDSKSMAIYKATVDRSKEGSPVPYLVISLADGVILHEGSYQRGYVKWSNDSTIEVMNSPGIAPREGNQSKHVKQIVVNQNIHEQ